MSFELEVKLAVYRYFAETGGPPSCDQVAERLGTTAGAVVHAYQRLRAQRVLVMQDNGLSVRMAPPFSGVATQHVVKAGSQSYFANCAWDALGIPAALQQPATIYSRCEQSMESLRLEVGIEGPASCNWVFHCVVPAAHWWDDIVFTGSKMLFFRSEVQVQQWCQAQGYIQRPIVRMDQLWVLAKAWYATRLQPDSRRPQPNEMREIFARCGLEDSFWDPEADSFAVPGTGDVLETRVWRSETVIAFSAVMITFNFQNFFLNNFYTDARRTSALVTEWSQ